MKVRLTSMRSAVTQSEYKAESQQGIKRSESKNLFSDALPKVAGMVKGTHYAALTNPEDYPCSINYAREHYSPMETMHILKRG